MGINRRELENKIMDWSLEFNFEIQGEDIILPDINLQKFIDQLDAEFSEWETKETEKDGKIENID